MPLVERPSYTNLLRAVLRGTDFGFRSINTSVSKYIWSGMFSTNNKKSVRCFERIYSEINALNNFCKQLKDGAFEGLCDCVCNRFIEWMNDKIRPFTLEHSSQEHIRQCFSTVLGTFGTGSKTKTILLWMFMPRVVILRVWHLYMGYWSRYC